MQAHDLFSITQKYCAYPITDCVQQLEFDLDIEKLRKEMFKFIIDNKFGFSAVSLRLPPNESNYISHDERLEANGVIPYEIKITHSHAENPKHNKEYFIWHPSLDNSYVKTLVPRLEKLSGLSIGRIRLGWLMPNSGYKMHIDYEPMRLHIPLLTNNIAYIIHDHKLYNMEYGKLYHLITTNIHTAWNFGSFPRLHLIFSTYADEEFNDRIKILSEFDEKKKNLELQTAQQGIDIYALKQLLGICNRLENFDIEIKKDILYYLEEISKDS